jgi:uncharacterized protein (TIGR00251 family)
MIIEVRVKTGAKKTNIDDSTPDQLIISLKKRPVDNEANVELIKILSDHFRVAKSQVTIKGGFKSKQKLVEILI